MEKIVETLQSVKNSLPTTCTHANKKKLQTQFELYQGLVAGLPGNYGEIKNRCKNNFPFLKLKIDAIEDHSNSPKIARLYFKDAVNHLRAEITIVIASVKDLQI